MHSQAGRGGLVSQSGKHQFVSDRNHLQYSSLVGHVHKPCTNACTHTCWNCLVIKNRIDRMSEREVFKVHVENMSSISAGTCPGCTLLAISLCLPPYVFLPWHIMLWLIFLKHAHTSTELWMNFVTPWWYIFLIYTDFKVLSLFMLPKVPILSLDIYGELMMALSRCLTAADTESRLRGHRHRQHWRAWNGAERKFHIWVQLWYDLRSSSLKEEQWMCSRNTCNHTHVTLGRTLRIISTRIGLVISV